MTQRHEALATAFAQTADQMVTEVDALSDAAWNVVPEGEARTAGQIAYHMAEVYGTLRGFMQLALDGQPVPSLTMEIIHGVNAEQATHAAEVGRAGTLARLRQQVDTTGTMLRTLSDDQLDTSFVFLGSSTTVERLAQQGLVRHTEEHLASIRSAAAV